MIVKLRAREEQYPDLSPEQVYVVIGIEADDFRLLNDQGRPYLYAYECFEIIDPRQPDDWITEIGEDGERYAYPLALSKVGFFEDFFAAQQQAVATFWHVVNQNLALALA